MALHLTQGTDDCALPVSPPRLVALIRHAMPEDGIVCLDNGLYKVGIRKRDLALCICNTTGPQDSSLKL